MLYSKLFLLIYFLFNPHSQGFSINWSRLILWFPIKTPFSRKDKILVILLILPKYVQVYIFYFSGMSSNIYCKKIKILSFFKVMLNTDNSVIILIYNEVYCSSLDCSLFCVYYTILPCLIFQLLHFFLYRW